MYYMLNMHYITHLTYECDLYDTSINLTKGKSIS